MANDARQLTPLEWLMPRAYVRQIFAFPSSNESVAKSLQDGLTGVIEEVPYLLSGVVSEDFPEGSVSLIEPYQSLDDLFSWQDLSPSIGYARMKEDKFPPAAFNVPELIPPDTIPPYPTPAPVFRARLSLVKGGFLLCIAAHHNTTDITGFGALLKLWASRCRAGSSESTGFDHKWLDRSALFQSEKRSSISVPELLHIREPNEPTRARRTGEGALEFKTGVFFFPWRTLQEIKQATNDRITALEPRSWVSTGDILTALLWSAVIEAESSASSSGLQGNSTIGLPVNFRSRLSISLPKDYMGAAFVMTAATASLKDLKAFPGTDGSEDAETKVAAMNALSRIALEIRKSITSVDEPAIRKVFEYIDSQADIRSIILGPRHDGISLVSWADQGVYELDWGEVIGRCEAVRLPKLMYKRYPIIQPRIPEMGEGEGGFEVIVSFDESTFRRFERARPIARFAKLRCAS
ncbi:hypothetical protein SLS62_005519 [Diatrype stigma]|uniref:Trichothecene 3-O-acetyltransferase n=1 Tax=Diatrype stigma TaxID=117547 RepID=A0AAN9USM4_9PEZI